MMNPQYQFARMMELLAEYQEGPAKNQAWAKLEEFEFWLLKCQPTLAAYSRDLMMPLPEVKERQESLGQAAPFPSAEKREERLASQHQGEPEWQDQFPYGPGT